MYGQRNFNDLKKMNRLIGKTFYEEGEGDFQGMIRTYYMRWNPFANKITPAVSNFHHAEPTPEMEKFHPSIMLAVMRSQPLHNGDFY